MKEMRKNEATTTNQYCCYSRPINPYSPGSSHEHVIIKRAFCRFLLTRSPVFSVTFCWILFAFALFVCPTNSSFSNKMKLDYAGALISSPPFHRFDPGMVFFGNLTKDKYSLCRATVCKIVLGTFQIGQRT